MGVPSMEKDWEVSRIDGVEDAGAIFLLAMFFFKMMGKQFRTQNFWNAQGGNTQTNSLGGAQKTVRI